MAFIITVAQRKGGVGKTTLCCHLTAAFIARGFRVAGLDLDDQKSFSAWASIRARRRRTEGHEGLDFTLDPNGGFGLSPAVRRASQNADIVILDTPPTAETSVGRAISLADLVLSPIQLSPLDLEASLPTARMIADKQRRALFVINRAPPRARIAERIRDKIRECGLPVAATEIGNRAGFTDALAQGRSVTETSPRSAAAREINALTDEILDLADLQKAAA